MSNVIIIQICVNLYAHVAVEGGQISDLKSVKGNITILT